MRKIKYNFYRLFSNKQISDNEYNRRNKILRRVLTVILIPCVIFAWIYYAEKDFKKSNILCANGAQTKGVISNIIRDNLNDGNISSWIIEYNFLVSNSKYNGSIELSDKPIVKLGDSIEVIYSNESPSLNSGFIGNIDLKCITFRQSLTKNWYFLILGLMLIFLVNSVDKSKDN
jgi:hypothetical protein